MNYVRPIEEQHS